MSLTRSLVLCALPLLAIGCKTSTTGEAGALSFRYSDPDQVVTSGLDTAIAAGTRARIEVRPAASEGTLSVKSATVSDPAVASVASTDGAFVVVDGVGAGDTTIEVEAGQLSDTAALRVAAVARLELSPLDQTDRVLVGGVEPLAVRREDASGERLVGEAPVEALEITPASGASREAGPDHRVMVRYLGEGTVELATGASRLSRAVVGLDQIASFTLLPIPDVETLALDGEVAVAYQIDDTMGEPLGARLALVTLSAADPSVCTATEGDYLGVVGFRVDPVAPGTCTVTATLGEHSQTYTVMVTE